MDGNYLTADLAQANLLGIASKYPVFFWTVFAIFVIACLGYGIYYFLKKPKNKV